MTSLYELTNEYVQAESDMIACGMDEQTIQDTLDGIVAPIEEKAINVAKFIGNMDMEIAGVEEAVKSMQERAKAMKSKRSSMISYLKRGMEGAKIDRLSCPYFELAIVNNPSRVVITGDVPDELMVKKVTRTPDKKAIKAACEKGNLEYAHVEHSTRLRIK